MTQVPDNFPNALFQLAAGVIASTVHDRESRRVLDALEEAQHAVMKSNTLFEALRQIAEHSRKLVGGTLAYVALIEPDGDSMNWRALSVAQGYCLDEAALPRFKLSASDQAEEEGRPPEAKGVTGLSIEQRTTFVMNDVQKEQRLAPITPHYYRTPIYRTTLASRRLRDGVEAYLRQWQNLDQRHDAATLRELKRLVQNYLRRSVTSPDFDPVDDLDMLFEILGSDDVYDEVFEALREPLKADPNHEKFRNFWDLLKQICLDVSFRHSYAENKSGAQQAQNAEQPSPQSPHDNWFIDVLERMKSLKEVFWGAADRINNTEAYCQPARSSFSRESKDVVRTWRDRFLNAHKQSASSQNQDEKTLSAVIEQINKQQTRTFVYLINLLAHSTQPPPCAKDAQAINELRRKCQIEIGSELVVPILFPDDKPGPVPGKTAVGAINIEHETPGKFSKFDQETIERFAKIAALAIERYNNPEHPVFTVRKDPTMDCDVFLALRFSPPKRSQWICKAVTEAADFSRVREEDMPPGARAGHSDCFDFPYIPPAKRKRLYVKVADATTSIADEIWTHIARCDLLIADLTGDSLNVLYEIGLAHGQNKPVILTCLKGTKIPADIQEVPFIEYTYDLEIPTDQQEALRCEFVRKLRAQIFKLINKKRPGSCDEMVDEVALVPIRDCGCG